MFQSFGDILSDPVVLRWIIGGIIFIIVMIVCYAIHKKLMED
ncbi:MAG: hypothetical protein ACFFC3_11165 [Candidatus Odinarchaeota archaeon]